jgi:Fic family protein
MTLITRGTHIDTAVINLAEFICESDAIEGIDDDPDRVIRQIQVRVKKMKEAGRENNWGDGHVGALLMLEEMAQDPINRYIDKRVICEVQGLIVAEQHKKPMGQKLPDKWIGEFRDCNVTVGGVSCPTSDQVHYLMHALLQRIHWWQQRARFWSWDHNLNEIASFHLEFETIHPFAGGNGRTGRALAYFMMRYAGLKPFVFTSSDRHELYYPCFANPKDCRLIQQYFFIKTGNDSSKFLSS